MFKLTPKEQKLLALLAFLLILGVVLRFTLPGEQAVAVQRGQENGPQLTPAAAPGAGTAGVAAGEKEAAAKLIVVHVVGAVQRPGVYHLPAGSRVYQALEQAGGGLEGADMERINLAQPLVDGQQVFLPLKGAEGAGQPLPMGGVASGKVNINAASKEELENLPGIGAVKAQSIINYRQQHGPFQRIEDLLEVSGIGEKTLAEIKELISVW